MKTIIETIVLIYAIGFGLMFAYLASYACSEQSRRRSAHIPSSGATKFMVAAILVIAYAATWPFVVARAIKKS